MIKKPLMALRDVVALPGVTAYIEVAKAETVSAMEAAMNDDQMVFTVAKKMQKTVTSIWIICLRWELLQK